MVASACLLLEHAATASQRFEGDWRGFMRLDLDGDGCISFDEYLIANTGDTINSIQTNGFVTVLRSEPHKPLLPSHVPEIPKREQNDSEAKFRMLTADDGEASSWSPKSTLKWSRSEEPFDLSAASSGSAAVYNETSLNEGARYTTPGYKTGSVCCLTYLRAWPHGGDRLGSDRTDVSCVMRTPEI
ncbi:hypothetical protein CYMTET_25153 [Cymbomonas tetramitiformis]|uniref:EF-hand domain-containing protein n=1 Tax=Cymbomonas tetramitiformis TaxID=36881 RepID=A0AAE0KZH0_9CHLO|nr:hypothetical protein CYMTET_25153 [Cymbomonas tetramitiformis]